MATNTTKSNDDTDVLKKTGIEIEGGEAVEDLEKKFKEISAAPTVSGTEGQTCTRLAARLKELEEIQIKLGNNLIILKEKVKKDLDGLKSIKEQVENELSKIKDLDKMKEKIDAEIVKIKELEETEKKIEEEVKTLEGEVKI
jgi:DNA repair ATPase RecN